MWCRHAVRGLQCWQRSFGAAARFYCHDRRQRATTLIVKMQLLTPAGSGAKACEMAVVRSRFKIEGFWSIVEPEIACHFEGRDYAFFEVQAIGDQQFKIAR